VGVLSYPTAARAAPWGVDGEPPGGRRAAWGSQLDGPLPRVRQAHDREGVVPHGPCCGNVAPPSDDGRVSCMRPGGGKTVWPLGYELPHPEG
jgi:hypothetical protein